MRILGVSFVLLLSGVAIASGQKQEASFVPQPHGTLAQMMRGIAFPSANLVFDVQTHDPGAPKAVGRRPEAGATETFANIYSGWETFENSALALAETANLLMIPGRKCENGRPVPVEREDFRRFSQGLVEAGRAAYKAAQTRDQEKAIEATNQVADACAACHEIYRDKGDAKSAARCTP